MKKVDEELIELKDVIGHGKNADPRELEHEIGDLLFSAAQLARHLGLEAEQCLRVANARFEKRFFTMKEAIADSGRDYDSLSSEELEEAWQDVKRKLET